MREGQARVRVAEWERVEEEEEERRLMQAVLIAPNGPDGQLATGISLDYQTTQTIKTILPETGLQGRWGFAVFGLNISLESTRYARPVSTRTRKA